MWFLISLVFILLPLFPPPLIFAHSEVQVIEMDANGFEPDAVTVDENSTVIFVNQDSVARWPASNVHPTHDLYPEFDPKGPIEPGKSWAFKALKAGQWKYHDHLLPHKRGTLTVIEEGEVKGTETESNLMEKIRSTIGEIFTKLRSLFADKKILGVEGFATTSAKQQTETIKKVAEVQGAQKAWQLVKDTFKGQAGSSGNIHDLAHLAGSLIYQRQGFSGITLCNATFAFGCYHGFLDTAFAKSLDHLLEAQDACLKLGPANSGPVASCIHGIGHGIASFYSTNDLKKSLSTCRKLTIGGDYCFDGVFMEFVRSAPVSFFKKDDPLYPCNFLEKEYGPVYSFSCGRNTPSLLMSRFKLGFDEIVNICLSAPSKPFKDACFDSLGFSLASSADTDQIIRGCQSIAVAEYILSCAQAAAGELVFQEVPNWQEKSKAICESFPQGRLECLSHVDRLIKEYSRALKINFAPPKEGEDPNSYIRSQMKVCFDLGGKDGCYKQVAQLFYDRLGLRATLDLFKANEDYPEVYARCHEVTHYLSRSEFEKQKSISKVYAQCDSTCHGGCYHGTMEAYLKQETDRVNFDLNSSFSKICGKIEDYQKPIEYNECLHGLGHAAMFVTDMEVKKSLKSCESLDTEEHKERCYTGVFMENSSSSTSPDHASIYIKKDDPLYPCNAMDERFQSVCWQYQSSYFSIISNQDWRKVASLCLQIPSKYQDKCFRTIGTNQVGFTSSLTTMKDDCDLMPTDHFKDICVAGVVSSLSYRFVGDMNKTIGFCSLVDADNRETCFKQMGTGLLDWDKNKDIAKQNCNKIPDPQGNSWCLSVI